MTFTKRFSSVARHQTPWRICTWLKYETHYICFARYVKRESYKAVIPNGWLCLNTLKIPNVTLVDKYENLERILDSNNRDILNRGKESQNLFLLGKFSILNPLFTFRQARNVWEHEKVGHKCFHALIHCELAHFSLDQISKLFAFPWLKFKWIQLSDGHN